MRFLMPPHPVTNFEIQKHYENEPRFKVLILQTIFLKK